MFEFPSDQYRFSSNRMSSVTSYHTEYTPLSDMTGGASTSDTRRFDRGVPLLRQDTLDAVKNVYGNSGQGGDYVKLAAKLVHDAMESRQLHLQSTSRRQDKLASIQRHSLYQPTLVTLLILNNIAVFFEDIDVPLVPWLLAVEMGALLICVLDIFITYTRLGFHGFIDKRWNMVFTLCTGLLMGRMLTLFITGGDWQEHHQTLVIANVVSSIRPILVICKVKRLRYFAATFMFTLSQAANIIYVILVFTSFYAILGVVWFQGIYTDDQENFDSFWSAYLNLIVLLTTENYPAILYDGYNAAPGLAVFYFISFIVIGVWLMMSLFLAVTLSSYKEQHALKMIKMRLKEHENLIAAFQVLTHGDTVAMGLKEFSELISLVKPGLSEEIILILFRELDDDHTDNIRPKEFLNLCDVLSYSIQYTKGFIPVLRPAPTPAGIAVATGSTESFGVCQSTSSAWKHKLHVFLNEPHPMAQYIVQHRMFHVGVFCSTVANIWFLTIWNVPGSGLGYAWTEIFNWLILSAYLAETLLRINAMTFRLYWRQLWPDFILVTINITGEFALSPFSTTVIQSVRTLRVLRVISAHDALKRITLTLITCTMKLLVPSLGVFITVFYIYAVVGVSCFSAVHPPEIEEIPEGFDSFGHALLALFQISTTNNWNDLMYPYMKAMEDAGYSTLATSLTAFYFVSFFMLVTIWLVNVLTSLIIDNYEVIEEEIDSSSTIFIISDSRGNLVRRKLGEGIFFEPARIQQLERDMMDELLHIQRMEKTHTELEMKVRMATRTRALTLNPALSDNHGEKDTADGGDDDNGMNSSSQAQAQAQAQAQGADVGDHASTAPSDFSNHSTGSYASHAGTGGVKRGNGRNGVKRYILQKTPRFTAQVVMDASGIVESAHTNTTALQNRLEVLEKNVRNMTELHEMHGHSNHDHLHPHLTTAALNNTNLPANTTGNHSTNSNGTAFNLDSDSKMNSLSLINSIIHSEVDNAFTSPISSTYSSPSLPPMREEE